MGDAQVECLKCDLKFATRHEFDLHLFYKHGVGQSNQERVLWQWSSARPEWGQGMHSGERKMLADLIDNDENVLALLGGTFVQDTERKALKRHKGVVVATNRRVLFLDKGLFGNSEVMEIAHRAIESITYSTGMFRGGIQVVGRGASSYKIEDISPKNANASFAERVRKQIDLAHRPAVAQPAVAPKEAPSTNGVSDIERIVSLLKDGHITEEEFATMKQRIIG